jgi:hypothetical protein
MGACNWDELKKTGRNLLKPPSTDPGTARRIDRSNSSPVCVDNPP